jgi:hypothetical protein
MKITDLVIEVRNSDLERVAQLTPPESIGLTAVVRFNNVGNWSITLPANNPKADLLREPGAGLIVNGPDGVILSGPTVSAKLVQTAENPAGDWVIEGVDDSVVLGERLAYPDPSEPDAGDQSTAYDEITDLASTVLYHYVDANIGPSAPIERKIPNLTLAADTGLGSTVKGKARFDVLGPYLSKLSAIDGLGFNIRQIDDELVFTVYQPNDLSDTIRLDVENNRLASSEFTYAAPNATRAIVAGQGQGAEREIVEVTTTEATTAEGEWSRRIEVFKDQRDSDDVALLEQSGLEILAENGKTLNAISVKPADNGLMRYGVDWNLGDLVSVVAGSQSVTAIVSEVGLSIEVDGVYLLATIGKPATADPNNKVAVTQSKQEDRIANLERNEAGSGGGGEIGPGAPIRGQVSRQTTGTVTITTQGVYVAAGLTPTFDTSVAVGTEIATTNVFGVKKTAAGKHFMRVYASADARAGNNQTLGIKIALNGTPINESECRAFTGSNDQEAKLVTSWIVEMDEGDEVSLFMANHSGTTNIAFQRGRVIAAAVTQPGLTGPTGDTGPEGPQGPAGLGTVAVTAPITNTGTSTDAVIGIEANRVIPAGGTTGQVLSKTSNTNYATSWQTPQPTGLVPIIPTSVVNGTLNSSTGLITFTGVSSVSINGAFSSAYRDYKIIHKSSGSSANAELRLRLRAGGVDRTSSYRSHTIYYDTAPSPVITGFDSGDFLRLGWVEGVSASRNSHSIEIFEPALSTRTNFVSTFTSYVSGTSGGGVLINTSYDGFTLYTSTGTWSGNLKIYGYN